MNAHTLVNAVLWPTEKASELVSKVIPHPRRKGKVVAGFVLMITGAQMSLSYPNGCFIPHGVYEALACFIHAIGCAPVFKAYSQHKADEKAKKVCKKS